jgi:hypothetical protein
MVKKFPVTSETDCIQAEANGLVESFWGQQSLLQHVVLYSVGKDGVNLNILYNCDEKNIVTPSRPMSTPSMDR